MVEMTRNKTLGLGAALLLAAVFWLACASQALAVTTYDSPLKVSDDVTRFSMAKLDRSSHQYVTGAQMAIINKNSQEVVASWTTGEGQYVLEKKLDVNTPYILRELSAPDGYSVAKDTEFYVNASETEGITIVSGDDAELTGSYSVALYDDATPSEAVVEVTESGGNTAASSGAGANKVVAPKTGDETPIELVVGIAVVALVAVGVLQVVKRRRKNSE